MGKAGKNPFSGKSSKCGNKNASKPSNGPKTVIRNNTRNK